MNEDSTDPSSLSCFTDPKPPESLVSDSSSGLDNSSEEPRFNIVVKEEPEDLDWDVNNTGASSDVRCSGEASTKPEHRERLNEKQPWSFPKCGNTKTHPSKGSRPMRTQTQSAKVPPICTSSLSQLPDVRVKEEQEDPAFAEGLDHCYNNEASPPTSGEHEQHQDNHTVEKPYL
ncbi:hypothetical protein DPEC_G00169210 [Dallia pectoralis]|uniref:Uncharacterized protein n=1 Tax=Dallia pectoralis TaxID=75939 RepID=A0ACC2GCH4_DALPE|nr:hypothetical protein DPEC_G00169210 [Dallia pectoralis]